MREIHIKSEEETREFGLALSRELEPNDVLALIGDLGVGKTALTRYIAEGLGVTEPVTSPTFTIVAEHHSGRMPLYHFDVYRLESGAEMLALGCDEYFDGGGVSVVEWADKVAEILPDRTKCIFMDRVEPGEGGTDESDGSRDESDGSLDESEGGWESGTDDAADGSTAGEERVYRCTF